MQDYKKIKNQMEQLGGKLIFRGDNNYPIEFEDLDDPPSWLTVLGDASAFQRRCLSVVGSREFYPEVSQWLQTEFVTALQKMDICIVSGAARGVDQMAHSAAIMCEKPTIAFLPSGFLQIYPQNFRAQICEIVNLGGCVVSEYEPQVCMQKHHFIKRNRMIAALSGHLFAAQAERGGGTLITAQYASNLGKNIGALPYFPNQIRGRGTLDLIKQGAEMIRDAEDLMVFMQKS